MDDSVHKGKGMMATRAKASVEGVRQSYPLWKARHDQMHNPVSYYVWEPIAFRLAPVFINWGFSANMVTTLGVLVLLCGLTCIGLGAVSRLHFLLGAVLLNLVVLLDNIDGHVARFTGQVSNFGTLFDFLAMWLLYSLFPVCLGVGLFFADPEPSLLVLGVTVPQWVWVAAGVVQMFTYLWTEVVGYQTALLLEDRNYEERALGLWSVLARAIKEAQAALMVPAAVVGMVSFLHILYAVYYVGIGIFSTGRCLRATAISDRREDAKVRWEN